MLSIQSVSKSATETLPARYSFWRSLKAAIETRIRISRDLEQLNAMSDHQLRDIGITRDQIVTAVHGRRRSFPPPRI